LGNANGGALHSHTVLTVFDSSFIDNQAIAGSGGSAGNANGAYVLDAGLGGALSSDAGALVVTGSTFSNNQAIGGSNANGISGQGRLGHGVGGAIQLEGLQATINPFGCVGTAQMNATTQARYDFAF
jgi:hypothetical protein